ncbi:hypothetical protein SynBIOSU31_02670 [Synechococcus sp. BIOS-U3-1]|nr:hypothetical protein SynBIOSU31_02670 [Synechococcus sp. BIOS-U3-1]
MPDSLILMVSDIVIAAAMTESRCSEVQQEPVSRTTGAHEAGHQVRR